MEKYIYLIITYILHSVRCEEMNRSKMYSDIEETGRISLVLEQGDHLEFPSDGQKLARISLLWTEYYECTARLTAGQRLPAVARVAYEGAAITLACRLCIIPGEGSQRTWLYSQFMRNPSFTPLEGRDNVVQTDDGKLTIYHVTFDLAGVYRCQLGGRTGGLITLEVVGDEEPYNVVKPAASDGPFPTRPLLLDNITVSSQWSEWSECSACGRVGRRRRYGMCYVQLRKHQELSTTSIEALPIKTLRTEALPIETLTTEALKTEALPIEALPTEALPPKELPIETLPTEALPIETLPTEALPTEALPTEALPKKTLSAEALQVFAVFPDGIPCRSRYLPRAARELAAVRERPNEIMIGLCKVQCKSKPIFVVRDKSGLVLERANNSEGVYSLLQPLPLPPPSPGRNVLFAIRGQTVVVRCPGSCLLDMPVWWRAGSRRVEPCLLERDSGGRVHVNGRDHVVFTLVDYSDTNMYSCWQGDHLCGTVKLVVWEGYAVFWSLRGVLIAMLCVVIVGTRVATRLLRRCEMRARMRQP